jgi:hypothetical protein
MERNISSPVESLDKKEIETILLIYHYREGLNSDDENILGLVDKNLVSTQIEKGRNLVSLTEQGFNVCSSLMVQKINESQEIFKEKICDLPERGVAFLVNRIMFRNTMVKESGLIDPFHEYNSVDEILWFERVLLKDERITVLLDTIYGVLEDIGLVRNINGQKWCAPEVEKFLHNKYRDIADLTWMEEDSLKYYFFFYVYAQNQKNLINFGSGGEENKSMFHVYNTTLSEYRFSSNRLNPKKIIENLGLSEHRIMEFLEDMAKRNYVKERFYPLSSFSFFSDEEKVYVIKDIKNYITYINKLFLSSVVNSLLLN